MRALPWLLALTAQRLFAADCAPAAFTGPPQEWTVLVSEHPGHTGVMRELLNSAQGFAAPLEVLQDWRVAALPAPHRIGDRHWYPLSGVEGLSQRFDACTQTLHLDLSRTRRTTQRMGLPQAAVPAAAASVPGGFLNLDLQYAATPAQGAFASLIEAGAFGGFSRGGGTLLLRDARALRLETFWLHEDPQALQSLRLGDALTHAGAWGRSARFAGIQWATDFALQPYFTTFPQPVIGGDAVLPSTLEVFVNGQRRNDVSTDGGPFELRDLPALTGAGDALLVVRDALGRETRIAQPFYVSSALLREGLSDFALEAGALRRDYGIASNRYGDWFASGTLRRGLNEHITGELRAELQNDRSAAGISGVGLIGDWGVINASAVYGQGPTGAGWLGTLGFEREVPGVYSLALRTQWTEAGFTQIGQADLAPARRLDFARLSLQPRALGLPVGGSLSALWSHEVARGRPDLEVRSLAYGVQVAGDGYLNLGFAQTCAPDCQPSARVDFTWSFGGQVSAALQHEHSAAGEVSRIGVQRNSAGALGLDARASFDRRHAQAQQRSEASAAWKSVHGNLTADLVQDGGLGYRLGAATGLAFLGGEAYWTRPVQGSFAVVRTDRLADVRVTADGREVGRTDEDGRLLVPDLRAWEVNRLSLAVEDIPIESDLPRLSLDLVPRARSGALADFTTAGP